MLRSPASSRGRIARKVASAIAISTATDRNARRHEVRDMPHVQYESDDERSHKSARVAKGRVNGELSAPQCRIGRAGGAGGKRGRIEPHDETVEDHHHDSHRTGQGEHHALGAPGALAWHNARALAQAEAICSARSDQLKLKNCAHCEAHARCTWVLSTGP